MAEAPVRKKRAAKPASAKPAGKMSTAVRAGWPLAAIAALSLAAGTLGDKGASAADTQAPVATVASVTPSPQPVPLVATGKPVQWWFAYKFSSQSFPSNPTDPARGCAFGGTLRRDGNNFSQHYALASSANPVLTDGPGLIGTSGGDPLGATFGEIYNGHYYFVVWNDQFYGDPPRDGPECDAKQCGKPWGHSKGILAWDQNGNGVIIQVTTPSWPAAGGAAMPRKDGNTLGCVSDDNNISNAQDFFALQLNRDDVKTVLRALAVASVSTDVNNPQIVNRRLNGVAPPADIDQLVALLGQQSRDKTYLDQTLSSGVRLITKPSALHVPSWQFVSSVLGGENLLTATWWASPKIPSTRSAADVHCWDPLLPTPPGRVDIAVSANWEGTPVAFTGGPNHAKIGVSLAGGHHYAIFSDLNQQGQLGDPTSPNGANCGSSQNGRGGMFFVLTNPTLQSGISKLIAGKIAAYPQ
ncbi:MAG TPA: deoxyribonuclease II family protein [Sphingomonas sp.]|uniref:deoxyribonuclease II family protein n=1 Tax=Sphingomonas sp. TaxID=28214 RepID=UPI002D11FC99|nr:deoxyribonuclease II family protein [Sphingomonas sp.]HMI20862.1 deoxyribonuclease II family protein [Sphingomonas sp.]